MNEICIKVTDEIMKGQKNMVKFVFWAMLIALPSITFALGGGETVGSEASKANAEFPFVMLGMLVIIAIIARLTK